jgi:hypothetical protein
MTTVAAVDRDSNLNIFFFGMREGGRGGGSGGAWGEKKMLMECDHK